MKAKSTGHKVPTKNIIRILVGTGLILMVPLVAMQFSNEVKWDLKDFVVIGGMLICTGLVYELIAVRVSPRYRSVIAVAFVAAVVLAWIEMAVGIFD